MYRVVVRAFLIGVLLATAAPSLAGEGRTPIWQPTAINASGKYIVTRDIAGSPGTPVIDILTTGVEIDLNGFTLTGNGAETIRGVGQSDIVIRNGSIVGGTAGIDIRGGADYISRVVIEDVRISSVPGRGIYIGQACDFALRRNIVELTDDDAILIDNNPHGCDGVIEENLVVNSKRGIVVLVGKPVPVLNNRLHDIFETAIYVDTSEAGLIQGNAIVGAGMDAGPYNGIHLTGSHGHKVRENAVTGASAHGIVIDGDDSLVLENVVRGSHRDGLRIEGSRNHVVGNTLNGNNLLGGGWGLHFVAGGIDNTYGRNMARGNFSSAAICLSAPPPANPPTTDFCDEQVGNSSFTDNFMPNAF